MVIEGMDIKNIKGIGVKTAALFNKVGVFTVYDLLGYYPRDYDRYGEPERLSDLCERMMQGDSEIVTVAGTISGSVIKKRVRNLSIINFSVKDGSGVLHLTYFNMPYLGKVLKSGNYYVFRGKIENKV